MINVEKSVFYGDQRSQGTVVMVIFFRRGFKTKQNYRANCYAINAWYNVLRKIFVHKCIHVSLKMGARVSSLECGRGRCRNGRGFWLKWQ
jgi:hypothetical protein